MDYLVWIILSGNIVRCMNIEEIWCCKFLNGGVRVIRIYVGIIFLGDKVEYYVVFKVCLFNFVFFG